MSKKSRLFTFVVILVLVGILSSACGKATTAPAVQPTTGGQVEVPPATVPVVPPTEVPPTKAPEPTAAPEKSSITVVIAEDPPSFNATVGATGFDALVMELVMLSVADLDEEGNAFPELALELPTIENGGVVIDEENWTMDVTWKLRQDIKWEDGVPVTADDVLFTYDAIINPETGFWIAGIDYVDSVEKIDDYSFVVHYTTVYPAYLTQFGGYLVTVWPAHYCDASQGFTAWDCGMKPLSNGPYVLKEWIPNDHLTFERNANYYEAGKPGIDEIVVKIIPEEAVRKQMLMNGDADLDMWTPENVIAELKDVPNVEVSLSPIDRWVMRIFFNLAAKGTTDPAATPHPILSDIKVRQAIQMAIDVDTITKEFWFGYAKPVWTEFFRPPYNVCDVPQPVYDQEAAKALLEEAGWIDQDEDGIRECHGCTTGAEEGYKMEMEFITYSEYGETLNNTQEFIAELLGQVGIKLNISRVEGAVLWDTYEAGGIEQSGNFDMDIWDDGYSGNDPSDYLWSYYHTDAGVPDMGYNYGRYSNTTVDEMIDNSYTLDEAARQDAFCQMATILNDDLPELMLFTTVDANSHSSRLQGVQSNANEIVTWNVAEWTIKE
ncbi:MAG TPA: peptide ABC transporter substrate-binding protein [Anaerolineales bacterium]